MIRFFAIAAFLTVVMIGPAKADPPSWHPPYYGWHADRDYRPYHERYEQRRHERREHWEWCRAHDYRPHSCR